MLVEDLLADIDKNGNYNSYHEATTNEINKMYFDIEHDTCRISVWKIIEHI